MLYFMYLPPFDHITKDSVEQRLSITSYANGMKWYTLFVWCLLLRQTGLKQSYILVSECSKEMWFVKNGPTVYFGDYGAN